MTIAICAIFAISVLFSSLFPVHMLQLSSYHTPAYQLWLKRSAGDFYSNYWPCAAIALTSFIAKDWIYIAVIALLALQSWINRPKKAKKPLKYTSRVIRLLAVESVIWLILAFIVYLRFENPANCPYIATCIVYFIAICCLAGALDNPAGANADKPLVHQRCEKNPDLNAQAQGRRSDGKLRQNYDEIHT